MLEASDFRKMQWGGDESLQILRELQLLQDMLVFLHSHLDHDTWYRHFWVTSTLLIFLHVYLQWITEAYHLSTSCISLVSERNGLKLKLVRATCSSHKWILYYEKKIDLWMEGVSVLLYLFYTLWMFYNWVGVLGLFKCYVTDRCINTFHQSPTGLNSIHIDFDFKWLYKSITPEWNQLH